MGIKSLKIYLQKIAKKARNTKDKKIIYKR